MPRQWLTWPWGCASDRGRAWIRAAPLPNWTWRPLRGVVQATADGLPAQALDLRARADHHKQHPRAGQAGVQHAPGAPGFAEPVHGEHDGGPLQSLEGQDVP